MERKELSPVVVYTLSVPTSVSTSVEQSFWARFRSRSTRLAHSEETLCSTYLAKGCGGVGVALQGVALGQFSVARVRLAA